MTLPPGVLARIVEVLEPEQVWLFGSRARETHGPDSDWDLMAVLPDSAPDQHLDLAAVWDQLRDLRRLRIEVIPIRRRDIEEDRGTLGELAEAVARQGHVVYDAGLGMLNSTDAPSGIAVEDREEIERRAAEARSGTPGVDWVEIKRHLLKSLEPESKR